MRMWIGVEPNELCQKHLLGEHFELHKHRHNFVKQHSMTGRIESNCLEPLAMQERHDALEAEIKKRAAASGRRPPASPFEAPNIDYLPDNEKYFRIDQKANRRELINRCSDCSNRIANLRGTPNE